MREIYEIGLVFRGFVIVNHVFKDLPKKKEGLRPCDDLRGAFISAINTFAKTAFRDSSIEYLESGNVLFIFKMSEVKSSDSNVVEPVILYGLTDKKGNTGKKNDKFVAKFMTKVEPILALFTSRYRNVDFCELNTFRPFENEIIEFFAS